MSMAVSDSSTATATEHNNGGSRYRRPRNQNPIPESDPNPHIISSNRSKSTISSLLLAPSSPTTQDPPLTLNHKKKNFTSFRGLGCAASSQVSVPAVIRSSADWDSAGVKKKKPRSKKKAVSSVSGGFHGGNPPPADVWCGPGIGFAADAASVGCVVSRRSASGRGKVDGDSVRPRERPACTLRRMVIPEDNPFLDSDTPLGMPRSRMDVFGSRHHRYSRYGFPEGLAEVVMLQSRLMVGGSEWSDRHRDWRLDVDHMSYEELLELGDRIGHVSTGLREDEIDRYVRKTKMPLSAKLLSLFPSEMERKCSVCQEEYESDDEMGKLECGHFYHIHCIKQWLLHKNACPICKSAAASNT